MDLKPRKEDLPAVRKIIEDPSIVIWYRPKPELINQIVKGSALTSRIPDSLKAILIQGKGIIMDKSMILKWYEDTLDGDNVYMLENGELFVKKEAVGATDGVMNEHANLRKDVLKQGE